MAILSNILLSTEDNKLVMTATDLEVTTQIKCPAEITEPGRVTVPAKFFAELVKGVSGEFIILRETENNSTILSCGPFSTNLFGLSATDYPKIPEIDNIDYVSFKGPDLIDAINKTNSSTANSDDTYNLSGIYLLKEVEDADDPGHLKLISTDGVRLNCATLVAEDPQNFAAEKGIIIPRKGLLSIRNMAEGNSILNIGLSENMLAAKNNDSTVAISLLDGMYPNYKEVVPTDLNITAIIYRKDLLVVLRRIIILLTTKYPLAKFSFTRDLLTISTSNPEIGQAEETVGIEYTGPDIMAGFNPVLLIDMLVAMNSDQIYLQGKESNSSYLMTGPEDPGYYGVVVSAVIND
jgi:DNA polymerase-3 subunit beta